MKTLFGLIVIAFSLPSTVWAQDTFVKNSTVHRTSRTESSLNIDSVTTSNRTEHYDSYSEKITIGGNAVNQTNPAQSSPNNVQQEFVNSHSSLSLSNVSLQDDDYADVYNINSPNGMTIHRSGSSLTGNFTEDISTRVTGTVYSVTNETYRSHETTAGVR